MPEHTDYHTPDHVIEYLADRVGVAEPEVLRDDD